MVYVTNVLVFILCFYFSGDEVSRDLLFVFDILINYLRNIFENITQLKNKNEFKINLICLICNVAWL